MQTKAAGIGATILVLGCFALARNARAATSEEFWPELDLWYRFNDAWRLEYVATGTRDDSGDRTSGTSALYVDYRMNDPISWSVSNISIPCPTPRVRTTPSSTACHWTSTTAGIWAMTC